MAYPQDTFGNGCWTYRFFRVMEMFGILGKGIKHEMSAYSDGTHVIYIPHTVEAHIAVAEQVVRSYFCGVCGKIVKSLKLLLGILQPLDNLLVSFTNTYIYIPALATGVPPMWLRPQASSYLFAIAFDTSSSTTAAASGSFSYTVTGSNPAIFASLYGDYSAVAASNSCTYNSVALTKHLSQDMFSGHYGFTTHGIVGCATGSNTFAWSSSATGGDNCNVVVESYSGVKQTGLPDATGSWTASGSTTGGTVNITTVASTTWIVFSCFCNAGNIAASTGVTIRQAANGRTDMKMGDSNANKSAGSNSGSLTWNSSTWAAIHAISFAEYTSASTTPALELGHFA